MRLTLSLALACGILGLSLVSPATAAPRRARAGRYAEEAYVPPVTTRVPASSRIPPDNSRYPKFQGGFHSRMMQDLGVPTGDRGMRGNGFQMYPW